MAERVSSFILMKLTLLVLHPGECGAWVIDADNFEFYGHIVASDAMGEAYVVPIQQTFMDIRGSLNASAVRILRKDENPESWRSSTEIIASPLSSTDEAVEFPFQGYDASFSLQSLKSPELTPPIDYQRRQTPPSHLLFELDSGYASQNSSPHKPLLGPPLPGMEMRKHIIEGSVERNEKEELAKKEETLERKRKLETEVWKEQTSRKFPRRCPDL